MNSLDKQLNGIIQRSISRNINVRLPISKNGTDRELLLEIINELERQAITLQTQTKAIHSLKNDISTIKHHHQYMCSRG